MYKKNQKLSSLSCSCSSIHCTKMKKMKLVQLGDDRRNSLQSLMCSATDKTVSYDDEEEVVVGVVDKLKALGRPRQVENSRARETGTSNLNFVEKTTMAMMIVHHEVGTTPKIEWKEGQVETTFVSEFGNCYSAGAVKGTGGETGGALLPTTIPSFFF